MSKLKKIVIGLVILVIAIPATAFGYVYYKLNSMYDSTADESILSSEDYKSDKSITNILLAGTDGRSTNDNGTRSDSMMILTVDNKNKNLKLTSLARDSYVDIPGHGTEKLTHAYAYGGINLLVETIEKNFELDIQNYAVVDFFSFMDIVDTIGGVSVDVSSSVLDEFNKYIGDCYGLNTNSNKGSIQYIKSAGVHKLNGYQALANARIRYNDTAFERDKRQRQLIEGLATSLKELPVSKYTTLLDTILPYVKTNMKAGKILSLGTNILGLISNGITQMEFPIDDNIHSTGGIVDGKGWVLQFTKDSLSILHDFIFENLEYNSSSNN